MPLTGAARKHYDRARWLEERNRVLEPLVAAKKKLEDQLEVVQNELRVREEIIARHEGRVLPKHAASETQYTPQDWVGTFRNWVATYLRIPHGHPRAGQYLEFPGYATAWLERALEPHTGESLLTMGRKNGKTTLIACYVLARLSPSCPLARPGWRGGVVSVNREKAGELLRLVREIAEASELKGLRFYRTPAPGRVESAAGTLEILSADRASGHASGFDDSIVDELGLFEDRYRELLNGMRSAVSARNGRFMAISIQGDSPLLAEILERREQPGTNVLMFAAPADCELDDRDAWRQANPGLGTVKSIAYMENEAARVRHNTADQATFRAFDLNMQLDPRVEMLAPFTDWTACETLVLPPKEGPCVIGLDIGGAASMTAAVCIWPKTWRCEAWGAFGDVPSLLVRSRDDGVGRRYCEMAERGEIRALPGRVTPVPMFLRWVLEEVGQETRVIACGADRYRKAEVMQAMEDAGLRWPMVFRGQGAHSKADGSADVRACQRLVMGHRLRVRESLLLRSSVRESSLKYDELGNPALSKVRSKGRIDACSALVIASGLAERQAARKQRRVRSTILG